MHRLIRNRVSAQLSRLKKRARMEELEQQVSFLKAQNSELMRQVLGKCIGPALTPDR